MEQADTENGRKGQDEYKVGTCARKVSFVLGEAALHSGRRLPPTAYRLQDYLHY